MNTLSAETYTSQIEIPREWIEKIESLPDAGDDIKYRQRTEFIKKYYGKKKNADIYRTLGMTERSYYKRLKRMKSKGEL